MDSLTQLDQQMERLANEFNDALDQFDAVIHRLKSDGFTPDAIEQHSDYIKALSRVGNVRLRIHATKIEQQLILDSA